MINLGFQYFHHASQYIKNSMPNISPCLLLICIVVLSGCQSLIDLRSENMTGNTKTNNNINYVQYYLLLTELSEKQLADESLYLDLISTGKESSNDNLLVEGQLKSALLYALPNSAFHSPFTAKSKLNLLSLEKLRNKTLNATDLVFFKMLKAQLNQQILLLNQLIEAKRSQKTTEASYKKQQLEFQKLTQQIIQLKKIEKNINEHEQ
jgi:hypothetical protein